MNLQRVAKIVESIESLPIGINSFWGTLLSIVIIRNFLENILEGAHGIALPVPFYLQLNDFLHITLSWVLVFFTITLIVCSCSRRDFFKTVKACLVFFPIILVVPLLDFFIFGSGTITYQNDFSSFWFSYLHLFDPRVSISYVTDGVRVEIALAVLFSFSYIYLVSGSLLRALAGAFGIFSSIFFYGYLPAIYNALFSTSVEKIINQSVLSSHSPIQLNVLMYLPVLFCLGGVIFHLLNPEIKRAIWVSLRLERLTIYLALLAFGVLVSAIHGLILEDLWNLYDVLKVLCAVVSLSFAFVFSTILNDLHDYRIDCLSNPQRPLVKGHIEYTTFLSISRLMLFSALFFAVPVNEYFILILIFILALSYVYSAEPFRLKRFVLIGHAILATIGMSVFLLGVSLSDGILAFSNTDGKLLAAIFIFFFVASHLKDIKDVSGDSADGVTTIATLFGADAAYKVVSASVILMIVAIGAWLNLALAVVAMSVFSFGALSLVLRDSEKLLLALQFSIVLLLGNYIYLQF